MAPTEATDLWKLAEELISDKSEHLLAVAQVQKCASGIAYAVRHKKAVPKASGKPRMVCITGSWSTGQLRACCSLYSCKLTGGSYQVTKSWSFDSLVRVDVHQGEPGELSTRQSLELAFSKAIHGRDTKLAIQVPDEGTLLQILAPLLHLVGKYPALEERRPTVQAYPGGTVSLMVQVEDWVAMHMDPNLERKLVSQACGGSANGDSEAAKEPGGLSLVSAKEERDLKLLLDRFAFDVGDIDEFQQRLQDELAALEAANIHAILVSWPDVVRVCSRLDDALALLDDVSENLATFDTKLLVMREDIAAIEARNNRLELQTRNNGKLLATLDSLLERLQLPPSIERALSSLQFDEYNLDDMVKAGWELYDHLEALSDGGSDGVGLRLELASMNAVANQRMRLALLAKAYAERAVAFIAQQLDGISAASMQVLASLHGPERCSVPDHSNVREQTEALTPLLHVVRSLQPDCLDSLGQRYTLALNTLLRKELRSYTSELRRAVAASVATSPPEPVILRGSRKEEAKMVQSFSTHHSRHSSLSNCLHLGTAADSMSSGSAPGTPISAKGPLQHSLAHQVHTAYERMLTHWVPLLREELDGCADFLMLKEEGDEEAQQLSSLHPHGAKSAGQDGINGEDAPSTSRAAIQTHGLPLLEALLAGIESDFLAVVDLASRQQQLQAVAMIAATLKWQAQVADLPVAAPLHALLRRCLLRLLANFERFIMDMKATVERYNGKGTLGMTDGVKRLHLLPLVPNFAAMVNRLEELQEWSMPSARLAPVRQRVTAFKEADEDREAEHVGEENTTSDESGTEGAQGLEQREESLQVGGMAAMRCGSAGLADSQNLRKQLQAGMGRLQVETGATTRAHGQAAKQRRRSLDSIHSDSPAGSPGAAGRMSVLTDAEIPDRMPQPRLVASARDVVDPAYAILARKVLETLERIAETDAKHGHRLRLENYVYFEDALREAAGNNAVLQFFMRQAVAAREQALQMYVQQQLEYAKMWRLVEFSQGVDLMIGEVGAEEVSFQPNYQQSDLRSLLSSTLSNCDKRLAALHSRMAKHLGHSQDLVDLTWRTLRERLEVSYSRLDEQVQQLYPTVQLPKTPEGLHSIMLNIA